MRMRRVLILCLAIMPALAYPRWELSIDVDPLTDKKISTAIQSMKVGIAQSSAVVRCNGGKLESYFIFGSFLDNDPVAVRFRVDKNPMIEEKWSPSANGSGVFANDDASVARALSKGTSAIIEAEDYRGQPHRVTFDLAGAAKAIKPVLEQCGVAEIGIAELAEGLRREVASELERWGPKNISSNKRILSEIGACPGSDEPTLNPEFAICVQKFYDDYILRCKEGNEAGLMCRAHSPTWGAGRKGVMPAISGVIYEKAPEPLKAEAGKLKMGD